MGDMFRLCFILVLLLPIIKAQNTPGIPRHRNEQDRLRCLGVQCPPERPRCITENQVTKCVASEPIRTVSSRDLSNNRLSRPALGFGSSQRQPSRPSQTFQMNEAEKSQRNLTQISTIPSSKSVSNALPKALDNVPSYCFERFQTGRCRAYFPRYYYNKETGRCHRFVYGGCGGNQNNFKSEQACKSVCLEPIINNGFNVGLEANYPAPASGNNAINSATSPRSYCQQTPERGPCTARIPRYYFNKQTGQCRSFLFGGCGGNRNNFQTLASCKRACKGQSNRPVEILTGETKPSSQQSPFPSAINNKPHQSGTPGFAKGAPPPLPQYCLQAMERGPCFAYMPRYYYNKEVGQCRSFIYGGCAGNRNNFQSMAACKRACDYIDAYTSRQNNGNNIPQDQAADILFTTDTPEINIGLATAATAKTESTVPEFCLLPKKVGPCRALMPRFFYNSETSRCEQFGFGGCQPNENNFKSERECKRQCIAPTKPTGVNKISGGERSTMQRGQLRQFNPVDSAAFREFLVSQQMNNDIDMVGPPVSGFHVCAQRMDPGTCNLEIRSYYFSANTRSCQPFIYHGCGGNQNRFSSLRACHDRCMDDSLRPTRIP